MATITKRKPAVNGPKLALLSRSETRTEYLMKYQQPDGKGRVYCVTQWKENAVSWPQHSAFVSVRGVGDRRLSELQAPKVHADAARLLADLVAPWMLVGLSMDLLGGPQQDRRTYVASDATVTRDRSKAHMFPSEAAAQAWLDVLPKFKREFLPTQCDHL